MRSSTSLAKGNERIIKSATPGPIAARHHERLNPPRPFSILLTALHWADLSVLAWIQNLQSKKPFDSMELRLLTEPLFRSTLR
jgi:hypothetical protein